MKLVFISLLGCLTFGHGDAATPTFSAAQVAGHIDDAELDEASGLAASRKFPGYLYTHNDHGDRPRLFMVNQTNAHVEAVLEISPAQHYDWEDLAVGPCGGSDGKTCIYVLDDGHYRGRDARTVYRIPEPDTVQHQTLAPEATLKYNWTEPGADTIMVDPLGGVYIIAAISGGRGMMINLPSAAWGQPDPVYVESGDFFAMYSSHTDPEGGDISPDGSEVLIKIANHIYYYQPADGDYLNALTHPGVEVPYHAERLGESVCWSADGQSYFTLGEGNSVPLYRYDKQ